MDQGSDNIKQDIETTRAALGQKLDSLESKAREAVDLRHHVEERPWMMLGAAVAAGYVLGSIGDDSKQIDFDSSDAKLHATPVTDRNYETKQHHGPSAVAGLLSHFDGEIEMLKTAAITTMTNFLRDSIREYVPALGEQLDKLSPDSTRSTAPRSTTLSTQAGFTTPTEDRDYVKTYHPPSETNQERAIGDERRF